MSDITPARVYVDDAFVEGDWGKWTGGGHLQAQERFKRAEAEVERLREQKRVWQTVANRWRCCRAGIIAAPDACPWHGEGVRDHSGGG